jgi:hypothetical protein
MFLNLVDDGNVCTELAKTGQSPQPGARPLARTAVKLISFKLAAVYQDNDVEGTEDMNKRGLKQFSVKMEGGGSSKLSVTKDSHSLAL